ncbi:succinate dehydrogenase, cytochrome b556 subunit [methane-oxidizing endosymbiont of Gigantopelta aegis]|uniref:succinate dehydrogenase, cytochrome b556 subunit n=1 Tax=methane-oxidizing endosymbiont of Gigantopelta aegis TaxID=2794938 RepID=UPI0018DDCB61|nr:succinate dehydrogenase, cytochrome b556 subunit [methane-oxidizing endosymbiont of Gigantopelta aegis]
MNEDKRPLSPHLQVYRLPLTGIISITHRMTGVLLSLGIVMMVSIFVILAQGEQAYSTLQITLNLFGVQVALWGFIYALFFHLCHGVRHLIWDAGMGFERDDMNRYAVIELIASVILTGFVFIFFQG